jgi:hypothetical protein
MMALQRFRCGLCLALVGMCLSVLLPGLQPWAPTAVAMGETVEICTSEGTIRVALEPSTSSTDLPTSHLHQSDCPYCHLKCHSLAWAPRMAFAEPAMAPFVAPLFLHAPQPLFAWAHVRSRAPPVFS